MAFSLDGHVALVTGSSTGLGKITARNLAAAGAKVAVNFANNRERAEASFAEFESTLSEANQAIRAAAAA